MERKTICGRFTPELEDRLIEEISFIKTGDQLAPGTLVVGSRALGLYLSMRLASALGSLLNTRIITLFELAKRIASLSCPEINIISEALRQCVIRHLISSQDKMTCFNDVNNKPGFIRLMSAAFEDIGESLITALPGEGEIEKLRADFPLFNREKLEEVYRLYAKYRDFIKDRLQDRSDIFYLAGESVPPIKDIFGSAKLIFYGIPDMNAAQKKFFSSICKVADVLYMIPYREDGALDYTRGIVEWLESLGFETENLNEKEQQDPSRLLSFVKNPGFPSELRKETAVDTALPGDENEKPRTASDDTFLIISAPGESCEVREIGREILNCAKELGLPFCDMAVILRTPSAYRRLLTEEFERLGIPYYLSGGIPLSETRYGKSFILLCDLVDSNYPRKQVIDFFTFSPLDPQKIPGVASEYVRPENWNFVSAEAKIIEGRADWEERLEEYITSIADDIGDGGGGEERDSSKEFKLEKHKYAAALLSTVNYLFDALESIPKYGTAREIGKPLISIYESLLEHSEELNKVASEIDAMFEVADKLGVMRKEIIIELMKNHIASCTKRAGRPGRGVWIMDVMKARGVSFPVVFIPGVVEKSFPVFPSEDPLLTDSERIALSKALDPSGNAGFSLKKERWKEERFLFENAVSSASQKLVLSFPRLEPGSAREKLPSIYLLQAAERASSRRIDYQTFKTLPFVRETSFIPGYRANPLSSTSGNELQLALLFNADETISMAAKQYLGEISEIKSAMEFFKKRYRSYTFSEYEGVIKEPELVKILESRIFRATELEEYTTCPYLYFHKSILRLKPFMEPERALEVDKLALGLLVHSILRVFYEECAENSLLPLKRENSDFHVEILEKVCESHFEEFERAGNFGLPSIREREKNKIRKALTLLIEDSYSESSDYIPICFEFAFGSDRDSRPPLELQLETGETLRFSGRIDRIDLKSDGSLRIIDYKTGKNRQDNNNPFTPAKKEGYSGYYFQTMIYLLAAIEFDLPGTSDDAGPPVGELLYILHKPGAIERIFYGGENFANHRKMLERICSKIAAFMKNGFFFPHPGKWCEYCEYSMACPADRKDIFNRKRNDSAAFSAIEFLKQESEL